MTIAAFMVGALLRLQDNPEPVVLFSAIITGTFLPATHFWVYGALLAVVFLNQAICTRPSPASSRSRAAAPLTYRSRPSSAAPSGACQPWRA